MFGRSREEYVKPILIQGAIWFVRLCAAGALIMTIITGLFIAGFSMADNQSAWPHVQLLLLVIGTVVAISFAEGRLERLIRRRGEPQHPQP